MKDGCTLPELAQLITQTATQARDFVAPARRLRMELVDDQPMMTLQDTAYPLRSLAHKQLASHLAIPALYYDRMLHDDPNLLLTNVNRWLMRNEDRRLLRTLGPAYGLRAYLSERYRPLDNADLAEAILPVVFDQPWAIKSCQLTDTRLYLKVICESIAVEIAQDHVNVKHGGRTHIVHPGFTLANSEVGLGALSLFPSVHWQHCLNLAQMGNSLRRNHVGRALGGDDEDGILEAYVSSETRQLEDRAVWMRVADLMRATMTQEGFAKLIAPLTGAAKDGIGTDAEAIVELTAKQYGLTDGVRKSVLQHLLEEGDHSRYGLSMALTRTSQDLEDYDDATELEKIGGQVLEMPRASWRSLVQAADKD